MMPSGAARQDGRVRDGDCTAVGSRVARLSVQRKVPMNASNPNCSAESAPTRSVDSNRLTMALAVSTMTLCGVTGVLMFFHFRGHLMNELHIWSGLALIVAMVFHLVRYRRALANHLRHWPVWSLFVLALVLVGAAVMTGGTGGGHGSRHEEFHGERGFSATGEADSPETEASAADDELAGALGNGSHW